MDKGIKKQAFCERLRGSWMDLANALNVQPHVKDTWTQGTEAEKIWEYAESRQRLLDLPSLLQIIDRKDLIDLFKDWQVDDEAACLMDDMVKTAMINRNEEYKKILQTSFQEQRYRSFIIAADKSEWPESLVHKLAYNVRKKVYSNPICISDLSSINSNIETEILVYVAEYFNLRRNPNEPDTKYCERFIGSLKKKAFTRVVYTRITADNDCEPSKVKEIIEAWENIVRDMEVAHYLIVLVEQDISSDKVPTTPPLKVFWGKLFGKQNKTPATFIDSYLEKLKANGLEDRFIRVIGSPNIDHVHAWIDNFLCQELSPHKREKLRQQAKTVFQEKGKREIPHNELGLALADLLVTFNTP